MLISRREGLGMNLGTLCADQCLSGFCIILPGLEGRRLRSFKRAAFLFENSASVPSWDEKTSDRGWLG
jgi:hypothetical protein